MWFSSHKNYIATAKDIVLSCDLSRQLLILEVHPSAYATASGININICKSLCKVITSFIYKSGTAGGSITMAVGNEVLDTGSWEQLEKVDKFRLLKRHVRCRWRM